MVAGFVWVAAEERKEVLQSDARWQEMRVARPAPPGPDALKVAGFRFSCIIMFIQRAGQDPLPRSNHLLTAAAPPPGSWLLPLSPCAGRPFHAVVPIVAVRYIESFRTSPTSRISLTKQPHPPATPASI